MDTVFGLFNLLNQVVTLSNAYTKWDLHVVANIHLDNQTLLKERLGKHTVLSSPCNDQELLLAAYRLWGEACVDYLQGAFVFAIWDSKENIIFCARDRIGTYPFFYHWHNKNFVFANTMACLVDVLMCQLSTNSQWIVDQLCGIWRDTESTFYNEVYRLPPAHRMIISKRGIYKTRYWDFDVNAEVHLPTEQAYQEAAREALVSAVNRCLTNANVGIELSGGLDSTTIAAIAHAERINKPSLKLSTYSHVAPFGMSGKYNFSKDERDNIELVRAFVGIESSHFFSNEQTTVIPMINKAIHVGGGATHCSFTTLTSGIHAMAAEQGVKVMLSGWGGDQLVSSRVQTRRYLLRSGVLPQLWRELNGDRFHQKLYGLFALSCQEFVPFSSSTTQQKQQAIQFTKRSKYVNDLLNASPLLRDYIVDIDWYKCLADWWSFKNRRPKSLREAQYQRITRPWLTNRLEATAQMAATVGIEYRYPLLDIELMSFFLALPADQKRQKGCDRYLFRCCTKGLLPEQFRWHKKAQGDLYPWYLHSLKNDLSLDLLPVAEDVPEEVKVNRLIAQAQRIVSRDYLGA